MNVIIKTLIVILISLISNFIIAQDSLPYRTNGFKIDKLIKQKTIIEKQERELLKVELKNINSKLELEKITTEEAETLKQSAAKKHALNIENRVAIIDNKIALLKRNEQNYNENNKSFTIDFGLGEVNLGKSNKPIKYDRRTYSTLVLAMGFNNAITENVSFGDSPYKFAGSRFFELGWAWKTRLFKNTNAVRLKYGVSLQVNGLKPKGNQYFVEDNNVTRLQDFNYSLNKSKLSLSNLVIPVHFEFGPSKKIEKKTYFRYSTHKQFKIGIGGYAGFNIGTRQKLKYKLDGERVKDKIKRDYNVNDLVYGLSTYIAFGEVALYAKYDLSPIFKDQAFNQNNISLGVRFDMD